jgi:hypothetical protein
MEADRPIDIEASRFIGVMHVFRMAQRLCIHRLI